MIGCLLAACFVATPPDTTAEELLKTLRRIRPDNPIIPSEKMKAHGDQPTETLFPEGYAIVERAGWLQSVDDHWMFQVDSDPPRKPVRVLPNEALEVMVLTVKGAVEPLRFLVSGEVTVFRERNYLLIHSAQPRFGQDDDKSGIDDTSTMKVEKPDATGTPNPTVSEVIKSMQGLRTRDEPAEVLPPPVPRQSIGGIPPNLLPEGTIVVQTPGRVIRQQAGWVFAFESDSPGHPQPPVELQPNQTLELMLKTAEHDEGGIVFLVTGDMTLFENRNYLLARVATRRIESGNLSK